MNPDPRSSQIIQFNSLVAAALGLDATSLPIPKQTAPDSVTMSITTYAELQIAVAN